MGHCGKVQPVIRILVNNGRRRMRHPGGCHKACCKMKKRCSAPYYASAVLRSVPSIWGHVVLEIQRFDCIVERRMCKLCRQCSGSCSVMVEVLISQPNTRLFVEKTVSPFSNLDCDTV
jgi:hypothetical protein